MTDYVRDNDSMPGHLARRFNQVALAAFHSEVEACGCDLTPVQYAALTTVHARPGIDQATLATAIACDRTTIAGVVERLARKQLISREVSRTDRRARELRITDDGLAMLTRIHSAVDSAQALITSGLTKEEVGQLMKLLRKAIGALGDLSRSGTAKD